MPRKAKAKDEDEELQQFYDDETNESKDGHVGVIVPGDGLGDYSSSQRIDYVSLDPDSLKISPLFPVDTHSRSVAEAALTGKEIGRRGGKVVLQGTVGYYLLDTNAEGVYNDGHRNWTAPLAAIEQVQLEQFPSDLGERLQLAMARMGVLGFAELRRDQVKRSQFLQLAASVLSRIIEETSDANTSQGGMGA